MNLGEVSAHCYNITTSYLSANNDSAIIESTKVAIRITRNHFLQEIFPRWNPFSDQISFSYNGGKDCQALLILYLSCLWEFFLSSIQVSQYPPEYHLFPLKSLPTVYINQAETFRTLEESIETTRSRYFLSVYESPRNQTSMPEAFKNYLEHNTHTQAIVIGIRYTDPFGADLKCVQKTDSDWPEFMRIQPLLHWSLSNVWSLLLYSNEEICGLYEKGFTSVGSVNSTIPNPYLKRSPGADRDNNGLKNHFEWEIRNAYGKEEPTDEVRVSAFSSSDAKILQEAGTLNYYPGWFLIDDSLERAGRARR
ncbi:FMN adenylyltransferase [Lachancea thermotolerans CBS 6340]|uniref:FAD synthase n=1 Tax=Lachancea thermotolerans (strain ATCC 56472 / CBS 6340 / NRRL Y-8284) TaxID=559295 RepID=C5DEE6_LACTC|nr:KLTH0C08558p [Lachancea thermotolerans CBS 6340]CAR22157.1 KLTH0C08558p [Lachancea thermotolerans CBS 6340]